MSCCGKKRKASDPKRPTLASPINAIKPGKAPSDASRDVTVTTTR
jgi:hypothetical protein